MCKVECKREDVTLRSFTPPQLFARFLAINRICSKRRDEDSSLKTQVRFGKEDLEILTKTKGTTDPFKIVSFKDFFGDEPILDFDYSIKWNNNLDKPPRRKVSYSCPSIPDRQSSPPNNPVKLIQNHSHDSEEGAQNKRSRNELSTEASESELDDFEMEDPLSNSSKV